VDDLVGKRMLLRLGGYGSPPADEFRILEVSPSGNWVKLQNLHGNKFWRARAEVAVVEELKPLHAGKPNS